MDNRARVDIIEKESGQRTEKELSQQKRFIYIGSDPKCDIVVGPNSLDKGVTPKHLQLIMDASGPEVRCRVVNLSASPIVISNSDQPLLDRLSSMLLAGGESLSVGAYDLVFHLDGQETSPTTPTWTAPIPTPSAAFVAPLPSSAPSMPTTPGGGSIGLRFDLPQRALSPDRPLDGSIYVMNLTNRRDIQVILHLEGLPPENFKIGQTPLLYPGAEQSVFLHLEHPHSATIPPGPLKITIWAEIGDADSKETVTASRDIQISPFFKHSIQLIRTN